MRLANLIDVIGHSQGRSKPITSYTAKIGAFFAEGKTLDEALTNLKQAFETHKAHSNTRIYRIADDGRVFCLYYDVNSWCYDIIRPTPGVKMASTAMLSTPHYHEALAQMEEHVKQINEDYHNLALLAE